MTVFGERSWRRTELILGLWNGPDFIYIENKGYQNKSDKILLSTFL